MRQYVDSADRRPEICPNKRLNCPLNFYICETKILCIEMGKIQLKVLGISYSQTQTGAYALVLSEARGNRRIPIIVGGFEAQAIAIELEGLAPPRPLTHDLFKNFSDSFGIALLEVNVHKLEEGVFFANIICEQHGEKITLDARTSDAIALAMRFKCPIFTTEEIVEKAGIVLDFESEEGEEGAKDAPRMDVEIKQKPASTAGSSPELKKSSMEELNKLLAEAVGREDYERASEIRDEIKRRST